MGKNIFCKVTKRGLISFLFFMGSFALLAQNVVKGKVIDENKVPVVGASIVLKGTLVGTTTNFDGNFSLSDVPEKGVLVISFIGMKTQEVLLNGRSVIDVILKEDAEQLEEVVIVGYGVQKKSSLTGAVSSISSKEIAKQVTPNVTSALQGQTSGVEILQRGGEAGAGVSILIRGASSFGSTEPLYIIDGAFSNSGLDALNPEDIASVEVLKDGAAAAIYGSRAANGVVIVTTKNGKKGETIIEVNATTSYQKPSKKLDFMDAQQWRNYANMVADNSPSYTRAPQNVNPTNPSLSTDWQDIYLQSAPMHKINISVSGGGANSTFNSSVGYLHQKGITIRSEFERYNARLNGTYKKGILSIQENIAISHSKKQRSPGGREILIPTLPVTDSQGRFISAPSTLGYSIFDKNITNPLAALYATNANVRSTDVIGSLGIKLNLFKGLKYKLNLSGSYLNKHGYSHVGRYASYWDKDGEPDSIFLNPRNSLSENRGETFNYTVDNLLTYKGSYKKHDFDILLGTSFMRDYLRTMGISSANHDLGLPTITTYNGEGSVSSNELGSALLSFFSRINYDYDNRYLLSLSIRRDESSKFAKDYRVGYFPSISVGWNIHSEPFFNVPVISNLKLRASYGELGANFIAPYQFISLAYGPVPTIFGNERQMGVVTRLMQESLKWETAISSNIGLELGFMNNDLTFTVDYFIKRNRDLLAPLELLPSSGQTVVINKGTPTYYNTASVENKGLELTTGYRKRWSDFGLNVKGNVTFLKNKVLSLGEGVQPIRSELMSSKFNDRPSITKEGLPIGTFWGYKIVGIDDKGDFIYEGADGKPKSIKDVSEKDKQNLGNPTPTFSYGLNINLNYKNWDLTTFLQGTYGNKIFAAAKYRYYFNYDNNNLVDALNSWTPQNTNTNLPIAKTDNTSGGNALPNSFYVEDGSYLRLKNLQIGYTFSDEQLNSIGFFKSFRLYAGVQNVFTLTKYSLYDPEVGSGTLFGRGIDGLMAPPAINARIFNIGIKLTF